VFKRADCAAGVVSRRGNGYLSAAAQGTTARRSPTRRASSRPSPTSTASAAVAIADAIAGRKAPKEGYDFPTVDDGLAGMAFIESAVKSSQRGAKWVKFPQV
jgi:hypothetical protein